MIVYIETPIRKIEDGVVFIDNQESEHIASSYYPVFDNAESMDDLFSIIDHMTNNNLFFSVKSGNESRVIGNEYIKSELRRADNVRVAISYLNYLKGA